MTEACLASRVVHTIGHSTRSAEMLVALLEAHGIQCVVDVRRWPTSRRFPLFRREALTASLGSEGIASLRSFVEDQFAARHKGETSKMHREAYESARRLQSALGTFKIET